MNEWMDGWMIEEMSEAILILSWILSQVKHLTQDASNKTTQAQTNKI